ncbi:unnamed protein product, partial [Onchocerca ochengi]|uniref:4Fe-4S ferredoxin-type domain-containing protein n=1 Tax=Onchocerca ochengi TaxID=42157 RepID=A0A182F0L7_ONCOC
MNCTPRCAKQCPLYSEGKPRLGNCPEPRRGKQWNIQYIHTHHCAIRMG